MKYVSTRGGCAAVSFTEAVAQGLASDGGLFVPQELPDLSNDIPAWSDMSYQELAHAFLKHFADDLPSDELQACIEEAYVEFDVPDIAPLTPLSKRLHLLELYHGPTLAFKDFALQLLGNLYESQIKRTGEPINVLGATSGDTGAAAIHGLLGRPGINIFILYPARGISPLQERQMTCTEAGNVFPIPIEGTFDDAQALVKEAYADRQFVEQVHLSAVNSINLARILAQSVYYVYAWHRLPEHAREDLTFVVPTGNFGNILAGWMAIKMGLPAKKLQVATNRNDILYRLFENGQYEADKVSPSLAPSMDIQLASNFERFLYYTTGGDTQRVQAVQEAIRQFRTYYFEDFDRDCFCASRMSDQEIPKVIAKVYEQYGTILDPHTACGFKGLEKHANCVLLSTAHPAKFPDTIESAIGVKPTHPSLEKLKTITPKSYPLRALDVEEVKGFIQSHAAT